MAANKRYCVDGPIRSKPIRLASFLEFSLKIKGRSIRSEKPAYRKEIKGTDGLGLLKECVVHNALTLDLSVELRMRLVSLLPKGPDIALAPHCWMDSKSIVGSLVFAQLPTVLKTSSC
jgi:hypothetical protein